jgi:hypothetical protein
VELMVKAKRTKAMIELESLLFDLAIVCPLNNCDDYCPMYKVRSMNIKEKLDYLDNLNTKEKRVLLEIHNACKKQFERKYAYSPV